MCETGGRVKKLFFQKDPPPPGRVGVGFSGEQQSKNKFVLKQLNLIELVTLFN